MSLDPNACSRCGAPLDLEMERDEGLCSDCQCELAGCSNGMEKDRQHVSRWFNLAEGQGILCLRLDAAPGNPLYVVTRPATGDYLADIHNRVCVVDGC